MSDETIEDPEEYICKYLTELIKSGWKVDYLAYMPFPYWRKTSGFDYCTIKWKTSVYQKAS